MGISNISYPLLINQLDKYEKEKKESVLLEMGIQENYGGYNFTYLRDDLAHNYKDYISVDLHKKPNVTQFDLSIYSPNSFKCDILTNFGTSEHVEYEEGQYNCWLNIHKWLSVGGIAIHEIPKIGNWFGHCRYYCDHNFFEYFKNIGYEIIDLYDNVYEPGKLIWCTMKKVDDVDFMDKETFFNLMSIDKNVSLSNIPLENNPKNLI
jgi:hypothetical protein